MIGVVLAGGESRRFGSQKAFHLLEGQSFYERVARTMEMSRQFSDIVISANDAIADNFDAYSVIIDEQQYKNHGPLAGIYSVMNAFPDVDCCVISVDTPFITTEAIDYLVNQYAGRLTLYRDDHHIHPTIGIYPAWLKPVIKHLLDNQQLALRHLFNNNTCYINVASVPGNWHANINTQSDLIMIKEGERHD